MRIHQITVLGALFGFTLTAGAFAGQNDSKSSSEGAALIKALAEGDEVLAARLLNKHTDVNARDQTGATPLLWATMRLDAPLVARLLKTGADPNLVTGNGTSPLQVAVENQATDIVALLLFSGANANVARESGETVLMTAARTGQSEVMKRLIVGGANVNAHEKKYDQTALMWSAGHPAQVKLLIENGADVHARTKAWNVTGILFTPIVTTLGVTGIPWNNDGEFVSKKGGQSALFFAVQKGDVESAKTLVDAGVDVNDPAADGSTALLLSLYKWDAPAADLRYATGLPPKFAPNLSMANFLLDRGAKANIVDSTGYTPLHGAVLALVPQAPLPMGLDGIPPPPVAPFVADREEALAMVKRLLDSQANPNAETQYPTPGPVGAVRLNPAPPGSTPLHIAAICRNPQLVEMLLDHGADPNLIRVGDGHSPFSVAAMANDLPAVTEMVVHGADLKRLYSPRDMLADPVESVALPRRNQNILHIAGAAGADKVIQFLAENGASLTQKNDKGETPLALADHQERFRYALAKEGFLGRGDPSAVRDTKTTDAIKKAMKPASSVRVASTENR